MCLMASEALVVPSRGPQRLPGHRMVQEPLSRHQANVTCDIFSFTSSSTAMELVYMSMYLYVDEYKSINTYIYMYMRRSLYVYVVWHSYAYTNIYIYIHMYLRIQVAGR